MRALLLALLVALLPLRGWVGDVMAMQQMPLSPVTETDTQAQVHECSHGEAMPQAEVPAASASATTSAHADCEGCSSCDICHSMVMAVSPTPMTSPEPPRATPRSQQPADASAEHTPSFKPPIA